MAKYLSWTRLAEQVQWAGFVAKLLLWKCTQKGSQKQGSESIWKALVQDANDLATSEDLWCLHDKVEQPQLKIPALLGWLLGGWTIGSPGRPKGSQ